jgi:hypothetical protein
MKRATLTGMARFFLGSIQMLTTLRLNPVKT